MNKSHHPLSTLTLEQREDLHVAECIISLIAETMEHEHLCFHHAKTIPVMLAKAYRSRPGITDKDAAARFGFSKTEHLQHSLKKLLK